MRRIVKLLSVVPVLTLGLAACDGVSNLTSPGAVQQQAARVQTATPATPAAPTFAMDPVQSSLFGFGTNTLSIGVATFGAEGGVVDVWNLRGELVARLVVPSGAVSVPALFTVIMSGTNRVYMAATARTYNDVGAQLNALARLYFNPARAAGTPLGLRAASAEGSSAVETTAPVSSTIARAGTTLSNAGGDNGHGEPPPGEGWVWIDIIGFSGWIIL